MVGNRPFILYGPINYLNNLQQRGFRTFGDLWDESYDQLEGPQRWHAMSSVIDDLLKKSSQQWETIVEQATEITRHNRKIVRQIIRDLKGI